MKSCLEISSNNEQINTFPSSIFGSLIHSCVYCMQRTMALFESATCICQERTSGLHSLLRQFAAPASREGQSPFRRTTISQRRTTGHEGPLKADAEYWDGVRWKLEMLSASLGISSPQTSISIPKALFTTRISGRLFQRPVSMLRICRLQNYRRVCVS
jgi:hypothetical protein